MPTGIPVPLATMFCHVCDNALTEDNQAYSVEAMCEDCCNENMAACEQCGDYGWIEYSYDVYNRARRVNRIAPPGTTPIPTAAVHYVDSDGWWMCESCVHICRDCGTYYSSDYDSEDCCRVYGNDAVRCYSYKPSPMFFDMRGSGNTTQNKTSTWSWVPQSHILYMGVEIEAERAHHLGEEFLDKAGEQPEGDPYFVYLKEDGSLGDGGVEIVTMPATSESFAEMFPFEATDMLRDKGARAWAYTRCGMHVHVSRSAFTASHMWKFIKWQTENWEKCVQFAGRESAQWASWNNGNMEVCRDETSKAVKARGYTDWANRYSAINLTPMKTVELRYFRPNLNKDGILRVIEFIQAIYDYTKIMSYGDVLRKNYAFSNFKAFMEEKPEYQHAYNYMLAYEI